MGYEFIQTVGNYKYIYFIKGYRENGKVKQKRTCIGKLNAAGQKIYKPEYLEKLQAKGQSLEIYSTEKLFSVEDVKKSTVRSYGLFHFLSRIAKSVGLIDALQAGSPDYWQELFMLSCYMVSSREPVMYCADWLENNESFPVGSMISQRISELLLAVKPQQRAKFFQEWRAIRSDDEFLALDITSHSSWSKLIEDVECGYNRDKEKLPQVNLCMLTGETSRLPIYQVPYSGSLKDVKTFQSTLKLLNAVTGSMPLTLVMDKGFYSHKNVTRMFGNSKEEKVNFVASVPFTSDFACKFVESECNDIDCIENTIIVGGNTLRAVTKYRAWNTQHKIWFHVYYNAVKSNTQREELYATVTTLRDKALKSPAKFINNLDYKKYLIIRRSEKQGGGYTVNIRKDVIEEKLRHTGWLVLISNCIDNALKSLQIYRDKDVVEKCFSRLKNSMDFKRLRVHGDEVMQNKLFVGFIGSVIMALLNRVMENKNLYKKYTIQELLKLIAKQRVQDINGQQIIYPLTKTQEQIYAAFGMKTKNGMLL